MINKEACRPAKASDTPPDDVVAIRPLILPDGGESQSIVHSLVGHAIDGQRVNVGAAGCVAYSSCPCIEMEHAVGACSHFPEMTGPHQVGVGVGQY